MKEQKGQTKAGPEKCKIKGKPTLAFSGVHKSKSIFKPCHGCPVYLMDEELVQGLFSAESCVTHTVTSLFTFLPSVAQLDS